jgi:glycosyltransferase involved in cell wall biosynthesis
VYDTQRGCMVDAVTSVSDVRWFRQNEYEYLVVPHLERLGLRIATSGVAPARVALVMNHDLAAAAWRYARKSRIPLVTYVWDLPPFRLGSGDADYMVGVGGHLLRLPRLGRRYTTRRGYYSRLRYVARHATTVWTPSRASATDVVQRFGVQAEPVAYCFNSDVFTSALQTLPRDESARRGQLRLLSISRLTAPKNHEAVLRAAARLRADVEFVGRGPMQTSLEALAARLGVACSIRSGLSNAELIATYRRATVVVCPSRFEGLGLTGIEGAMCQTPVVASDIPTHREFLGTAAHFFALDNDDSLVAAIEAARASPAPPVANFASLTIEAAAQRFYDRLRHHL